MDSSDVFTEPVASTSRGIVTLAHKPDLPVGDADAWEQEDDLQHRRTVYEDAWRSCNERIKSTVATLHDASLDEITQYVHTAHGSASSMLAILTGRPPIRTGLIIGAGPGTSSLVFSALCRQLVEPTEDSDRDPCIVSRITSRECSNLKSAMRALIAGFVGSAPDVEDDGDGDEDLAGPVGARSAALAPEDMHNLVAWYNRRNRAGTARPTLVILLEDLEAMEGKVLAQMLDVLSRYAQTLPIVFLIGVATSVNALHEVLPRRSTNLLDVSKFYVEPGIGTFNALIRGLFIDWDAPLGLGPDVFQYLLQTFEDMHQSIDAVVSSLQYLYLSHFTTQPHALFAATTIDDALLNPSSAQCQVILALPSAKAVFRSEPDGEAANGLRTALVDQIGRCREIKEERNGERQSAFHLLLVVQDCWQKERTIESILGLLYAGRLAKYSDELCAMILQSNFEKIERFLKESVNDLTRLCEEFPAASSTVLEQLQALRKTFEPLKYAPRSKDRLNLVNTNVTGSDMMYPAKTLSDGDKKFSTLAQDLVKILHESFGRAFEPTSDLLLHELWFANDVAPLEQFHPSILRSYLATLKGADDKATGDGPVVDVAVAYRLYRETGKLINLGDWWMTFELAAENEPDDDEPALVVSAKSKGKKRARDESDEEESEGDESEDDSGDPERRKQARFLRSVGDLAFTGFLQPTTRKAEHALKSVF